MPTIVFGILLYILIGRKRRSLAAEQQATDTDTAEKSTSIPWKRLVPFILLSVATGTIIMSVSAYLSLYAVDKLGTSESTAAMLMAITPAVGFIAAPVGGYL